jgi:hypothetical protein
VLEHVAEPAKSKLPRGYFGHCLNIEWPDAGAGQISPQFGCYPSFPPRVVEKAVVKWQGAMFEPSRTSHVQIAGIARSDVSDVRMLYKDERGARRDARVDFAIVAGTPRERAGAERPFGVFLAFLPPAWLGHGASYDPRSCPPEEHPYDPDAVEVIAYDHEGQVLARKMGNNILSFGGPSPCP